ncbi:hypothetical protein, partial [Marinitenerispora sediminis]
PAACRRSAAPRSPADARPRLTGDRPQDETWEAHYRVGAALDVAGAAVTVLAFDRPFGFDARFALVSRDTAPGDDPTSHLAPWR